MQPLKALFSAVFGASHRLSDLERLMLDSVRACLDIHTAELWDKQIQAINKIQRLPEGSEVNFYRMHNGKPSFDSAIAFANKTEELRVAKLEIKLANVTEKLTAIVWVVNGFLFSIEYKGNRDLFEEAADEDTRNELKIDCELKTNLTDATKK
jgi:hypothetical protein